MDEDLKYTYGEICKLDYYDLLTDYEFMYEPEFSTKYMREMIKKCNDFSSKCKHIYFEKINSFQYEELLSKRIFEKDENVSDDLYYNKDTGLYFNIKNAVKGIDLSNIVEELSHDYIETLDNYFRLHNELQNIDNDLYLKGMSLVLTRK